MTHRRDKNYPHNYLKLINIFVFELSLNGLLILNFKNVGIFANNTLKKVFLVNNSI